MPVDPRFTIRAYERGDEAAILDLFARSFHAPRSLAEWQWKYERNPWGNGRISLTFDADGRLVAHYAGYPVPFAFGDRDVIAQQIGDTMTEPAIRHIGRGPTSILGRTALHFYARFCEREVAFNYGFNVANIQKFSLRFLRSERVEPVTYRAMRAAQLAPISRFERWPRALRFKLVTREDFPAADFDALFARVRRAHGFLVRRDGAYVRWRYLESPAAPYHVVAIRKWWRVVGWFVFRIRERRFTIGDLLLDPHFADEFGPALRHVVRQHPVDLVEGWFSPRPQWLSDALGRIGFATAPEPQDLSVMTVPFVMADAAAQMRARLYYTWGDSDLF